MPGQNAFGDRLNGKVREQGPSAHGWRAMAEARQGNEELRRNHNTIRPHRSLGRRASEEFAAADREQLNPQAVDTIAVPKLGGPSSHPGSPGRGSRHDLGKFEGLLSVDSKLLL